MTIKELQLPLSDVKIINLPKVGQFYTKTEVDRLIKEAVDEARRIDEESMRKHNRSLAFLAFSFFSFSILAVSFNGQR